VSKHYSKFEARDNLIDASDLPFSPTRAKFSKTQSKRTLIRYKKDLNEVEGSSQNSQTSERKVALIARHAIDLIQEYTASHAKITFNDVRDYVDSKFPGENSKQRRTYDVVNILLALQVLKKKGKWLVYDANGIEGPQAAIEQCQRTKLLESEMELEAIKARTREKFNTLTQSIRSTIQFKRLIKRNEKLEKKEKGSDKKIQLPFIIVKYRPDRRRNGIVFETRPDSKSQASFDSQSFPRIKDSATVASLLSLPPVDATDAKETEDKARETRVSDTLQSNRFELESCFGASRASTIFDLFKKIEIDQPQIGQMIRQGRVAPCKQVASPAKSALSPLKSAHKKSSAKKP